MLNHKWVYYNLPKLLYKDGIKITDLSYWNEEMLL